MTEHELANAKRDLADYAAREGFALGNVYVERIDCAPAAFQALVAEVKRREASAVIVPGVHHLSPIGEPQTFRNHLERCTGARVLSARQSP